MATVEIVQGTGGRLGSAKDLPRAEGSPTPGRTPFNERQETVMAEHGTKRLRATALIAVVVAGLLFLAAPAKASAPLYLTFEKESIDEGVWAGTVSGDVNGDLTTFLTGCTGPNPCSGDVWHVEFDWVIDAGDQSFTAHLSGVLNTLTGSVIMNGPVVDGFLEGAQVHEEGQLVNPATLAFEGTIQVMPETA